ncbi:MAG: (R)-1-hydroxy-2-aminoethylphosphonate ammonia-lyase [Thermoleophilaceae bacterium]
MDDAVSCPAPKGAVPPGEGDTNLSPHRRRFASRHDARTQDLLAEDARYFLHQSLSTPCLSAVQRAQGIWLEDLAGRRYLDFHGNSAHHLGYGHPRLIAAIKAQLDELPFAPRRFTNWPSVALARKLAGIAPGDLSKALFAPGGSEAVEMALKLARAATGRHKTVSFWDSFHGAGFGAASVGGEAMFRSGAVGPLLAGTEHVAPFACYRCPYGYPDDQGAPRLELCRMRCAEFVRYVLEKERDVAAVIAEPVRAVPYLPPPGFWQEVRAACDEHGALLIFDEIPCGLGKTGRMFACEHFGVTPDILVLGKALGGGVLPLAAILAKPELDVLGDYALGHYTHEKNPVLARAALATIEIIEEEGLVANAARLGAHALARLGKMRGRHRMIGDVRGLGLLLGVELVRDRTSKEPASEDADAVLYRCLERGLSFKTTMGNVLTLSPPLIIGETEMDQALDILDDAIGEVEAGATG